MTSISLKKIFAALLLAAVFCLSACGGIEEPEVTTAGSAGTLAPGNPATSSEEETSGEVTEPDETNAPVYAATWSLAEKVSVPDGGGYELPAPSEEYAEAEAYFNYLTGLETGEDETLGIRRPTAVCMYNDYESSRFQCGTEDADVIFEIQLDYSSTALMALYYNPTSIAKIGCVRSATPAMAAIAAGFDSYLLHCGTIGGADNLIASLELDRIDARNEAGTDCFYNDTAIGNASSYAYSYFTTSGRIAKSLLQLSEGGAHFIAPESFRSPFAFADEKYVPDGNPAGRIRVFFGGFQPYFLYNNSTGLYDRYQHGAPHRDTSTGSTLAFKNVIFIYTDTSFENGYMSHSIVGSGSGIYASGGRYIKIIWSKDSEDAPFVFTDGTGKPVLLNRGKTFVSVVSRSNSVSIY